MKNENENFSLTAGLIIFIAFSIFFALLIFSGCGTEEQIRKRKIAKTLKRFPELGLKIGSDTVVKYKDTTVIVKDVQVIKEKTNLDSLIDSLKKLGLKQTDTVFLNKTLKIYTDGKGNAILQAKLDSLSVALKTKNTTVTTPTLVFDNKKIDEYLKATKNSRFEGLKSVLGYIALILGLLIMIIAFMAILVRRVFK